MGNVFRRQGIRDEPASAAFSRSVVGAVERDDAAALERLLRARLREDGATALRVALQAEQWAIGAAAGAANADCLAVLLAYGAPPTLHALGVAVQAGAPLAVAVLLDAGANPRQRGDNGLNRSDVTGGRNALNFARHRLHCETLAAACTSADGADDKAWAAAAPSDGAAAVMRVLEEWLEREKKCYGQAATLGRELALQCIPAAVLPPGVVDTVAEFATDVRQAKMLVLGAHRRRSAAVAAAAKAAQKGKSSRGR